MKVRTSSEDGIEGIAFMDHIPNEGEVFEGEIVKKAVTYDPSHNGLDGMVWLGGLKND